MKKIDLTELIAQEGIVLLKNDGTLPLDNNVKKLALLGKGARRTIKGGSGSGDVNVKSFITIEQALLDRGIIITTKNLLDDYDTLFNEKEKEYYKEIENAANESPRVALIKMMSNKFEEPEFRISIKSFDTDVCIYVVARNSGEGSDRKKESGDYYLSDSEIDDIRSLSSSFKKFVLLLNVGGPIDLTPIKDYVGSILLVSQGGSSFGNAVASILFGEATPSGKLAASWIKNFEDISKNIYDSLYIEDIFVGYRKKEDIQFSFGFGLSYTQFVIELVSYESINERIELEVEVSNIGNEYEGKETVQVYVNAPEGKLKKPYLSLIDFKKSGVIKPGETQRLTFDFSLERVASYDEEISSWVLEKGEYQIYIGNSSDKITKFFCVKLDETLLIKRCTNLFANEECQLDEYKTLENNIHEAITFTDLINDKFTPEQFVAQLNSDELATLCVGAARIKYDESSIIGNASRSIPGAAGETTSELKYREIPSVTMADGPAGIRINPKVYKRGDEFICDPKDDPIFSKIIPKNKQIVDLSKFHVEYNYCTALPVATMLAQTWNMDLLEMAGDLVGNEMEKFNIDLWLAPALNIQKHPLCGRNFEYFSEDPLLSGLCAASITNGVQKHNGKGVVIKHLAANNQETNRNYNNSVVSERALREIYLKGFEICIRESSPVSVMTSVNLINGIHTANSRDLLTALLRNEWGFDGFVMTDWGTTNEFVKANNQKYEPASSTGCIHAGNDLIMPGSQGDKDRILDGLKTGEIKLSELQNCGLHIIKGLLKLKRRESYD